jgi:hypothetical protein
MTIQIAYSFSTHRIVSLPARPSIRRVQAMQASPRDYGFDHDTDELAQGMRAALGLLATPHGAAEAAALEVETGAQMGNL